MKSTLIALFSGLCLVLSQVALAHPGHDHSHVLSEFIHAVTALSIVGVIVSGVIYKQRYSSKKANKEGKSHDA